ncbi:SRPBCC domain-containing protein [Jiulongibacter sediminis]|uniref:SRPBCC domain-containing protein n=1 Tax=Jiulongibacter sediminis TaxID=1605367 RepID=UPI001E3AB7E1|nr:SRPBCC domain-containing protein [Jiulongibacter sediminis]
MSYNGDTTDREIILTRTLNHPVEKVWEVFAKPEHIKNWWGPNGFSIEISKMDLQPQGDWQFVMDGPDGQTWDTHFVFHKIVPLKTFSYDHLGTPKFRSIITFKSEGKKTHLHWHMIFESREVFLETVKAVGANEGLKQTVGNLENYLADHTIKTQEPEEERQIRLSRVINHPIKNVWQVWTEPDHIKNWWGPHGFTNTISKMEMNPGGEWNLTMHGPDGTNYRNESVFVEIIHHKKIVYDHLTGPKFRATVLFKDLGDKTNIDCDLFLRLAK